MTDSEILSMNSLSEKEYYELHLQNLTPLNLKIDVDLFLNEIEMYQEFFQQWGDVHKEFARYALPLVNLDGKLIDDDPACWPLDRWNFVEKYPHYKNKDWTDEHVQDWKDYFKELSIDDIVNELYFKKHTPLYKKLTSVSQKLNIFDDHLLRTCILNWDYLGHFKKHIDTLHPTKWLRLWGTTNPKGMVLRYEDKGTMIPEINIEVGRLYLHDSIRPHEALAFDDGVYQFFIALDLESIPIIKELM